MCIDTISENIWRKLQEVKNQYCKKNYILDSFMTMGNYGTGYKLHKNCKKYYYNITIEYNINYSVDDIMVRIEKSYMGESIEHKREYVSIK